VGGATIRGFKKAIKMHHDIIFKIDGDNQHNPDDIKKFLKLMRKPGVNFCKGSRFKNLNEKKKIPFARLFGNIILTNLCRINCKNKEITDVVNGFIGIKSHLLKKLNLNKISNDFFFEEDLLFRVSFIEKKIYELPIKTIYNNKSNLSPIKTILPFIFKHFRNFLIRLNYEFL
jgi:dolichol-phosphate mannosyltransferase